MNILMLIADDMSNIITNNITPNLINLIDDGVYYKNAFSQFPVCGPSRSSFLTGMRPNSIKNFNFLDKVSNQTTIPSYLLNNNYDTYTFGKVFHEPFSDNIKIDYYQSHWSEGTKFYDFNANSLCKNIGMICNINLKNSPDNKNTNEVIKLLKQKKTNEKINEKTNKKFFIALGFYRPHISLAVPKPFIKNYQPDFPNTTLITNKFNLNYYECNDLYKRKMVFNKKLEPMANTKRNPLTSDFAKNKKELIKFINYYYSSINYIDYEIGRIIKTLKELNYYDNTMIIFLSDHGWNYGQHGMWCKNSLYKNIINVPLIIKYPIEQKIEKQNSEKIVELIDIFPTIIEVGSLPPLKLDGQSLKINKNKYAISQYPRCNNINSLQIDDCMHTYDFKYMGYSIIDEKYQYITWLSTSDKKRYHSLLFYNNSLIENKQLNSYYDKLLSVFF